MLDNLYLDKLKGRITESEYDKFYKSLYADAQDTNTQLSQLQQAETDYYITAKYVLDLVSRAHELYMSSEVEEKRLLLRLVLQNLRLEGQNIVYNAIKPFDLLLECSDRQGWCALSVYFSKITIDPSLIHDIEFFLADLAGNKNLLITA